MRSELRDSQDERRYVNLVKQFEHLRQQEESPSGVVFAPGYAGSVERNNLTGTAAIDRRRRYSDSQARCARVSVRVV